MAEISPTDITLTTADGWSLAATIYDVPNPTCAIVISAGTGFPRQFYARCAAYLAAKGARVLTFDYRGIGGSAPEDLATADIEYTDWGQLDLAAAIDHMADQSADLPLYHVAHSVGGHFVGLLPNHERVAKHAFISVGSGFFRFHHLSYIPFVMFFWWVLGPVHLTRWGYIKSGRFWRGGSLPPAVYRTWRRWCHRRDYFAGDLCGSAKNPYTRITAPIQSWVFSDDPVATPKAAQAILDCYPNADTSISQHVPQDFDVKTIGHDGAFRRGKERLWDDVWMWLTANS